MEGAIDQVHAGDADRLVLVGSIRVQHLDVDDDVREVVAALDLKSSPLSPAFERVATVSAKANSARPSGRALERPFCN